MSEPTKEQIAEVFNSLMSTARMYEGIYGSPTKMIIKVIDYWVRCSEELAAAREESDKWEQLAHDKLSEVCRQIEKTRAVTEQRDRLAEALRKAISWGDSASHHILHRQNINWTYLNEAKEALQSLNQPAAVKGGCDE